MLSKRGLIALMGSGELTSTMVEVHKELLGRIGDSPRAVFLDTPAGFQLNVDQIYQKAQEYFQRHVQKHLQLASYKSSQFTTPYAAEQCFHLLRESDYVLIGPGSPTYAVRQWKKTPISKILTSRLENGSCLVAASAAALTVGRFTLPVYEIYKVGEDLHWVEGLNILANFGFNLIVIPHWNNAEGGTHDTRFCYMGEPRFRDLEALLPEEVGILGLDEHTVCIMDLQEEEAVIKGIGCVTLRQSGSEMVFEKGDRFHLDLLRGKETASGWKPSIRDLKPSRPEPEIKEPYFWDRIHEIETAFQVSLDTYESKKCINALLDLDRTIWKAQKDLESEEFISQAREILREMMVLMGTRLETSLKDETECLTPLVEELLRLRQTFRQERQWQEADAIRDSLNRVGVIVEDSQDGSRWRLGI
jgi:peptidase E